MTSFSGSINLLESLAKLRQTLNFASLLKDIIEEMNSQVKRTLGKVWGKGVRLPCPVQVHHSSSISICSPT